MHGLALLCVVVSMFVSISLSAQTGMIPPERVNFPYDLIPAFNHPAELQDAYGNFIKGTDYQGGRRSTGSTPGHTSAMNASPQSRQIPIYNPKMQKPTIKCPSGIKRAGDLMFGPEDAFFIIWQVNSGENLMAGYADGSNPAWIINYVTAGAILPDRFTLNNQFTPIPNARTQIRAFEASVNQSIKAFDSELEAKQMLYWKLATDPNDPAAIRKIMANKARVSYEGRLAYRVGISQPSNPYLDDIWIDNRETVPEGFFFKGQPVLKERCQNAPSKTFNWDPVLDQTRDWQLVGPRSLTMWEKFSMWLGGRNYVVRKSDLDGQTYIGEF